MSDNGIQTRSQDTTPRVARRIRFRRKALNYAGKANIEQFVLTQDKVWVAKVLAVMTFTSIVLYFSSAEYSDAKPAEVLIDLHSCVPDATTRRVHCHGTLEVSGKIEVGRWLDIKLSNEYSMERPACGLPVVIKANMEKPLEHIANATLGVPNERYRVELILNDSVAGFSAETISCHVQLVGSKKPLYRIFTRG